MFLQTAKNGTLTHFYGVHGNQPDLPGDVVFPLSTVIFSGHQVSAPRNVRGLLHRRYPYSGIEQTVPYKWRCYLLGLATLWYRPRRCPAPTTKSREISDLIDKVLKANRDFVFSQRANVVTR